ncbi:MAG TPA: argininosuccinate lyase [Myxococcales bacterium]|nr:argininosuccinate lyase [Myxococcales bacterium]
MTIVGSGAAGGGAQLLPEVLAFSTSLPLDKQLLTEDVIGSLAHLIMLARQGIVPREKAALIRAELARILTDKPALPDDEDVHMAVETLLSQALGETAGMLHTARSRNDQVALDLRLHVREQAALALEEISLLLQELAARAAAERETLLPGYTHRQRAQPVSAAYYLCAWGAMFGRDAQALRQVLVACGELPLGVGALGGTSLPIERETTRQLLHFEGVTANGLDTVGDRDFALDFAYCTSRALLHASRVATDVIDFATAEFAYVRLDDQIAMGSSMMPQKRNPDLFELIRGKSGRAVGNLNALLMTVKGLPGGYNRDLQEDRQPLLETGPLLISVLRMLRVGLSRIRFDGARGREALADGSTAATDIAEALAERGVPFRTAYKLTGALVRACTEKGVTLSKVPPAVAQQIDQRFTAEVLAVADAAASVSRKRNAGGTGPASIEQQIQGVTKAAEHARAAAAAVPRLARLLAELTEAQL